LVRINKKTVEMIIFIIINYLGNRNLNTTPVFQQILFLFVFIFFLMLAPALSARKSNHILLNFYEFASFFSGLSTPFSEFAISLIFRNFGTNNMPVLS